MPTRKMVGTDGGEYSVVAETEFGVVGFRRFGDTGTIRIRVEPAKVGDCLFLDGSNSVWRMPNPREWRYSCEGFESSFLKYAMIKALMAVGYYQVRSVTETDLGENPPVWLFDAMAVEIRGRLGSFPSWNDTREAVEYALAHRTP